MGNANHTNRWIECYMCGKLLLTSAPRKMCPECQQYHEEEETQERRRKRWYHESGLGRKVKVVYDPVKGGELTGGSISTEELKCGISMQSFLPGTIFEIHGQRKVLKQVENKYTLVIV